MEKKKRDDTATLTAEAHGVTPAYVRMVVNGIRKNDTILYTYNKIKAVKEELARPAETTA